MIRAHRQTEAEYEYYRVRVTDATVIFGFLVVFVAGAVTDRGLSDYVFVCGDLCSHHRHNLVFSVVRHSRVSLLVMYLLCSPTPKTSNRYLDVLDEQMRCT